MTFERLELLGKGHECSPAAVEDILVCGAQCLDEPWSGVASLLDQVNERVEVVEEKVRIDFAAETLQLGLEAGVLHPCASQPIALPIAKQEDGFVDVRDGDDK